jgi:NAD-dependent dihydropyrimidine dehydrogenase PreA subunit
MKRKIIQIDEEKCDGCGICIPECHEGALQLIDGKARLISDLFCDGLGACIGHCPQGAIEVIEREAEPYNERLVMQSMIKQGKNTIIAHLKHLIDHNETGFLEEAWAFLEEEGVDISRDVLEEKPAHAHGQSCPGSKSMSFQQPATDSKPAVGAPSALSHWPIQFHLISPMAQQYHEADLLLAADCVAFSAGNFHQKYLDGKSLVIGCPKLDHDQQVYLEKLKALIDQAKVNTITVMIMQVPCCGGLVRLVQMAAKQTQRKVPIKAIVISVQGDVLQEEWL